MTAPSPEIGVAPCSVRTRRSSSQLSWSRATRSGSLRRIRSAASAAATEAGSLPALKTWALALTPQEVRTAASVP